VSTEHALDYMCQQGTPITDDFGGPSGKGHASMKKTWIGVFVGIYDFLSVIWMMCLQLATFYKLLVSLLQIYQICSNNVIRHQIFSIFVQASLMYISTLQHHSPGGGPGDCDLQLHC
jgi:CDP-diglyceride synthetase